MAELDAAFNVELLAADKPTLIAYVRRSFQLQTTCNGDVERARLRLAKADAQVRRLTDQFSHHQAALLKDAEHAPEHQFAWGAKSALLVEAEREQRAAWDAFVEALEDA